MIYTQYFTKNTLIYSDPPPGERLAFIGRATAREARFFRGKSPFLP